MNDIKKCIKNMQTMANLKSLPPMPALLLAGGMGTRLKPITDSTPKCLVPILGQPLLEIWLQTCLYSNMNPIIINLSYLAQKVEEFLFNSQLYLQHKDRFILVYEDELQGTGGTLLSQKNLLNNGSFFVAHADNLSFFFMQDFYNKHKNRPQNCLITAMSFYTNTPQTCGIFELGDFDLVQAFHEKSKNPPSNLANGAVYFMEPPIFDILGQCDSLKPDISLDILPHCLGRMQIFHNEIYHQDIGNPESYAKAQKDMQRDFSAYFENLEGKCLNMSM